MAVDTITPGCSSFFSLSFRRSVVSRFPAGHRLPQWRTQRSSPSVAAKRSPKRLKYASQRLFKKEEGMIYVKMDPTGVDAWRLDPVPLSILCHSLHDIDTYTTGFPRGNAYGQTNIFRAVKNCLPGPYTFILPASKELPKKCIRSGPTAKYASRKHVGVRMPDDIICMTILKNLNAPLISTSVKCPTENQWIIDPVKIADIYEQEGLDFVVDGGVRVADPSTVVDMTKGCPTILRLGKGPRLEWMEVGSEEDALSQEAALQIAV
ncbi:hypothetical protein AXF42_Ash020172 [Apostasia shenzhenica]|uniref:Threonylcarbamoyl-AMP synthase n=1 Tax=Apostasia shenzhenica TaxID=1088818 RepID=A0A2H9ZVZ6_9ASPA|nr:hypothetical protein AXF42_Ash020172 [Apostasia shenzhenica]